MGGSVSEPGALSADSRLDDFFVPDLCAARPVLMMVLLTELSVIVFVLATSGLRQFNWDLLASCSLFVQWVVLLSAAVLCQLRKPFGRLQLPLATASSMLVVLLITALCSFLYWRLFPLVTPAENHLWWLLRNMLVAAVLTGIVLRYFFLQQQLRLREKLELQSRLDSLRARIRPHFLFNTLNSIASLIASRPEAAEQAVEDLAELFRASLQEDGQLSATVEDEVRRCELYLGIEKLRLGDRLQVEWQVDEAVLDAPMPGLLLQPLVENAVYHGISRLSEGGTVRVRVSGGNASVNAIVENPVPAGAEPLSGNNMAMSNIRQRLQALYGNAASLQTMPGADRYRIELHYPAEEPQ